MHIVAWFVFIVNFLGNTNGQDDSLRSAVEALGQRQRELDYEDNPEYGYTLERPEDLVFLNPSGFGRERSFDRPVNLNYYDEDPKANKRISSAFRERVEEDNQRQQLEEMAENLISNLESRGNYNNDNEDYDDIIKELWDEYRRPNKVYATSANKRWVVPRFGLDGAGLRKRSPYGHPGGEYYEDTYAPKDDSYDDDDDDYNYLRKRYLQNKFSKVRQMYANPYSGAKRFPVTKRSSDSKDLTHENKRNKKKTDPKVEKELSNIFGSDTAEETTTKMPEPHKTTTPKKESLIKESIIAKSPKDTKTDKKIAAVNKEQFVPVSTTESEKSLQIKKKSIDWSDYFGLDRRKKSSDPNDLDKQWLIERYHKSIKMSNKKRSTDLPLSTFRNHDELRKKSPEGETEKTEDQRINEMDTKLQVMEDKIVDDTLKFTGANEGETDPKEVQEVKDKIISRLAAAYSLEKMRVALGEYRRAVAKEKERLRSSRHQSADDDYLFSEEKRNAFPRKHVSDKDRDDNPENENGIKCSEGDEDCHEQIYKGPSEITDTHYGSEVCPAIVRVCNRGAVIAGEYKQVFKTACHIHEICLLCSNNSWFPPTRQCHSLFLAKAFDLCKGDPECQKVTQRSGRYLPEVTRSFHTEDPSVISECEMSCPETESVLEPIQPISR